MISCVEYSDDLLQSLLANSAKCLQVENENLLRESFQFIFINNPIYSHCMILVTRREVKHKIT